MKYLKYIVVVGFVLAVAGWFLPLETKTVLKGAFTIGWSYSTSTDAIYPYSGLATKVGIGTTSPSQALSVQGNGLFSGNIASVSNITATGTINTNALNVTGNGTSTFNGDILARGISAWQYLNVPFVNATSTTASSSLKNVSATNFALTSLNANECVQTAAGGFFTTSGAACGVGGGGGKTISMYDATSTITTDYASVRQPPSTTTALSAGESLYITATCSIFGADTVDGSLNVGNPGGGTTTLWTTRMVNAANQVTPLFLQGIYTSTTTGTARLSIDEAGAISPSCTNYNFMYLKFTN